MYNVWEIERRAMVFIYDGISIQNQRRSNMDSLLLKQKKIKGQTVCIAAVCDGIGSLDDGAFASSVAIRKLNEWFSNLTDTRRMGLQMRDVVMEINKYIIGEAEKKNLHTGTTLSALLLDESHFYIAHTGDSRIYAQLDGTLMQLTEDQSIGGRLTACLGRNDKMNLFYNEGSGVGNSFLLCSDGLYKRIAPELLQYGLEQINSKNMRKVMDGFVKYVREQGERDNISMALILRGK